MQHDLFWKISNITIISNFNRLSAFLVCIYCELVNLEDGELSPNLKFFKQTMPILIIPILCKPVLYLSGHLNTLVSYHFLTQSVIDLAREKHFAKFGHLLMTIDCSREGKHKTAYSIQKSTCFFFLGVQDEQIHQIISR